MKAIATSLQKILTLRYLIYLLSYSIPLIITHPQIVTGTIVNVLLFISSERLSRKDLTPIYFLPSLGAVTLGILFGPQTFFLYYFLPVIWLGNYLLAAVFSLAQKLNYINRVLISAGTKYFVLFFAANIFFHFKIVPSVFITSMGIIQFTTAFLGGILSFIILKLYIKNE